MNVYRDKVIARVAAAQPAADLKAVLFRLGLGFVLLLAAGLRFYRLAGQSLWADEGNSVALARASLAEIAARTALDIHPPLYYWLLHGWMRVFGEGEAAVRSLSAVAGVLLVALIYRLGKRLFGPAAGLLAAFVAAVSPFQVYYAQEARMYALLALWGAAVVWATVEWIARAEPGDANTAAKSPQIVRSRPSLFTRYAFLYVLAATLGLYTHYAFPVVLAAANAAVLLSLWRGRRGEEIGRRLAGWLALQLLPLAVYLPWLPVAWRQVTTWPAPTGIGPVDAPLTLWRTLILGPVAGQGSDVWLVAFGLLGLLGAVRLVKERALPLALLLLLYLALPVVLTLVLFKPAYLKFLLVASPALCLLLAVGLAGERRGGGVSWGAWMAAGMVAAAAGGPLTAYYTDPAAARDDYRGLARYLEAVAGPEDAILLNAAGQQEVFGYYYRGDTPVYPLPRRRPLDPEATLAELDEILARSRRIYALYWAAGESDPAGLIETWLEGHAFKATDAWVGNVRLASYAAPLPAADLLPIEAQVGDHIRLNGYQVLGSPGSPASAGLRRTAPGEIVQVQLRWTAEAALDTHYTVFLQALDSANHLVGQRDAEPAIPAPDWKPGQPVLDRHGLLIEPGTPPGEYRVIVGLYDPVTGRRLATPNGDFVDLGVIQVDRPSRPPPGAALSFRHPAGVTLGPLRLLGYDRYQLGHSYDPDTPLRPGDPLHVVLYWQMVAGTAQDWTLALQLIPAGDAGAPVAQGLFPAAGVDYPVTAWEPGEIVRAQFDIFVPGDASPGAYRVTLHLVDAAGSPATDTFSLAPFFVD